MKTLPFASNVLLSVLACASMSAALSACGAGTETASPTTTAPTDAAVTDGAVTETTVTDAAVADTATQPDAAAWPRTVTLSLDGAGLDLATGVLVRGGGDVSLSRGRVIDVITGQVANLCPKGVQRSLDEVPSATDTCLGGNGWVTRWGVLQYSASAADRSIGASMLVREAHGRSTYRMRIVRDLSSYDSTWITVEYAPLW